MLNVIMLSVIMLSVVMLNGIMISVVMLSVILLSDIMLSVVMLSIVAPMRSLPDDSSENAKAVIHKISYDAHSLKIFICILCLLKF